MKKVYLVLIQIVLFFSLINPTFAQAQTGITVDPSQVTGQVSPTFFGAGLYWQTHGLEENLGFHEIPEPYVYKDEVTKVINDLNLDVIRFGGPDYDWTWKRDSDLDHPLSEKYGTSAEAVSFRDWFQHGLGINQYINLLNSVVASPYWIVNIEEGHLVQDICGHPSVSKQFEYPGTVQETRELAAYLESSLSGQPVYWTLDLEPWLQYGENCQGRAQWTVQEYVERSKQHVEAIKETYPNARFAWAIPGLDRYWPGWDSTRQKLWLDYIVQNAGNDLHAVSFTNFYQPNNIEDYLKVGEDAKWALETLKNNIRQTGRNIEIDVNGFGINCVTYENCLTGEVQRKIHSVAGTLAYAQMFKEYLAQGVKVAQPEMFVIESVDPIANATQSGSLITSGGGPVWERKNKPPEITSLYILQKLLTDHIGGEIIGSSTNESLVDTLTTKKGNTFYTLIINKNNEVKPLPINIAGIGLKSPARAFVVGNGSTPHDLTSTGSTEIRTAYISVSGNTVDFYAEPYSVSVVEVDIDTGLCDYDLNQDGTVNLGDLTIVLSNWGNPGGIGNLNGDQVVNLADLAQVLSVWGTTCD